MKEELEFVEVNTQCHTDMLLLRIALQNTAAIRCKPTLAMKRPMYVLKANETWEYVLVSTNRDITKEKQQCSLSGTLFVALEDL